MRQSPQRISKGLTGQIGEQSEARKQGVLGKGSVANGTQALASSEERNQVRKSKSPSPLPPGHPYAPLPSASPLLRDSVAPPTRGELYLFMP